MVELSRPRKVWTNRESASQLSHIDGHKVCPALRFLMLDRLPAIYRLPVMRRDVRLHPLIALPRQQAERSAVFKRPPLDSASRNLTLQDR